jgi:hypothetical protein
VRWRGQTQEERDAIERKFRYWHRVFAFIPHHLNDGDWAWLEHVERRAMSRTMITGSFIWEWRREQR